MKTDLTVAGCIIKDEKVLLVNHVKRDLWLPPGGHIETDETPDDAIIREINQELDLEVMLLNTAKIPEGGEIIKQLAVPFYCNVHSVGSHYHSCQFYICKPLTKKITMKQDEIKDFYWFSELELRYDNRLPEDVRNIALLSLKRYGELKNDLG